MERKLSKRKMLRRKYKHYAAALAGAAILTGAGAAIPATTFAAENPANIHPITLEQQALADSLAGGARYSTRDNSSSHFDTRYNNGSHYDTRYNSRNNDRVNYTRYDRNNGASYDTRYNHRYGWHRHNNSWPSSDDNRALYKDGQIYYSNR
jgi:hypothetical protein